MITKKKLNITFLICVLLLLTQTSFSQQNTGNKSEVLSIVDDMPQFPGGEQAMMEYLMQNLTYPLKAAENCIQGRVFVRFVVAEDGNIKDAEVMRSVDPLLDAEALRIINKMPKWKPGLMKGEPVSMYFSLPITFKLQGCDEQKALEKGVELTPAQLEAIDDSNHPAKAQLIGVWDYLPQEAKISYEIMDQAKRKRFKNELRELTQSTLASMKESISGVTDEFDENNLIRTTHIDKATGKEMTDVGMYKLLGDTLYVHSPISSGTQAFACELKGGKLYLRRMSVQEELKCSTEIVLKKKKK